MKSLNEIIGQAKLTKVGTIIARYILDHTTESCFMTSTELANTLDVSEASIIRFTRSIGFNGYMDFQKYLQKCHLDTLTKIPSRISDPAERFAESMKDHPGELHFGIEALKIADSNLRSVFSLNGVELFNETLDLILNADNIYIVSGHTNIGLGNRLYYLLKLILPNVYTAGINTGNAIEHLCDISPNDCLISFCLPQYSKIDITALQFAKDAKAKVILITDMHNKHILTLQKFADKLLRVDVGSNTYFTTLIGTVFLIELIADGISRKIGKHEIQDRLKRIEQYNSILDIL